MTETESGDLQQKNNPHLRALDRAAGHYTATARHNTPAGLVAQLENAYEPDIAAQLDTLAEALAERFGVPLPTAQQFVAWHKSELRRLTLERLLEVLAQIAGVLMWRCKNHEARAWGFAFALGMAHRNNGVRDMSHLARKLNCTVALISHYKRHWDRLLPPDVRVYGKSAQACGAYHWSRLISYGYRTRTAPAAATTNHHDAGAN